ncbi:MAG: pyridoxamine 5'-phosphate oxidase family protein [Caulobacter sp.]|nr:pyridoxamine 5'-phosphate oxidase family protein [Caulobacter sp.]
MADLTLDDLDRIYGQPKPTTKAKSLDHVDKYGRQFLALSPFCVISAADANGAMDVSPRGGEPGFVHVEDDRTVMLPDRPGNNRLDTLRNLVGGNGRIGMMFLIPGFDDVYRINGRARLSDDPALLERFVEFGRKPRSIVTVAVEEAFLHCPKAIMRGRLWETEAQVERTVMPTLSEMILDQLNLGRPTVDEAAVIERYRTQL